MSGGIDGKTLGSELRRQYAKRNRAQVMIDFLETSGIASQPIARSARGNPSASYRWQNSEEFEPSASVAPWKTKQYKREREPRFEQLEEGDFSPARYMPPGGALDPTEANDRELI